MFRETITAANGTTETCTATEAHALDLLRTAVRRNYHVEATRTGGAVIVRDVWNGSPVPRQRTITLEPAVPVSTLAAGVRRDLEAVAADTGAYLVGEAERPFKGRVGRVRAGCWTSIAPGAAARLIERGLLIAGDTYADTSNGYMPERRRPVRLSLAARLALLAQAHRTTTREPRGYMKPADLGHDYVGKDSPGGGVTYDRSSTAWCSCESLAKWAEDRDTARRVGREHRRQVAAELVAGLA